MFGYVEANKPELKIKDFEKYRSYYCGLCRELNNNFRLFGRLTLNFDLVFLEMVLADLYDEEEVIKERRCIIHPLIKHKERISPVSTYSANMCVLLSYYKLVDDYEDEKKLKARICSLLLKKKIRKIEKEYPVKAKLVSDKMRELNILEKENESDLDRISNVFGEILGEMFIYKDDFYKTDLYNLGFYLGKFIYLGDSYCDIEEDIKKGEYNPLIDMYKELSLDEFNDKVQSILTLIISEATLHFERLPIVENEEILRNILYAGVWLKFSECKNKERKND